MMVLPRMMFNQTASKVAEVQSFKCIYIPLTNLYMKLNCLLFSLSDCPLTATSCLNGGTFDQQYCECLCPLTHSGTTCAGKNYDTKHNRTYVDMVFCVCLSLSPTF